MFTESLLESNGGHASGRRWATLASLSLQSALVAVLIVFPMLRSDVLNLQAQRPLSTPIFTNAPEAVPEHAPSGVRNANSIQRDHPFEQPSKIPTSTPASDPEPTAPSAPCLSCVKDGTHIAGNRGLFDLIGNAPGPLLSKPELPQRVRLSEIELGQLVHRVVPAYPEIAKRAGIQGDVVLTALIGRDGGIQSLGVSSGNPFLVRAATDAVRQWRYRPFRLNGEAVEVETQITVRFAMNR